MYGQQLFSWSPRNYCQLICYDRLQRQIALKLKKEEDEKPVLSFDDFNLVELFTYGDQLLGQRRFEDIKQLQELNLWGVLYRLNDLSGIHVNHRYNLQGQITKTTRQMVQDYKAPIDWRNKDIPLEPDIYSSQFHFNAIQQIMIETPPDGSAIHNNYNQAGELYSVSVSFKDKKPQSIITHSEYDANGQKILIQYGNGVNTTYDYEPTTLQLQAIKSSKPLKDSCNGKRKLIQDIAYTQDPVGNITRMRDRTIKEVFYKGQKVIALSDYTYDPLYRLIKATGREHPSISNCTYARKPKEGNFNQASFSPVPDANDSQALINYCEHYTHDDAGNLIEKKHETASSASSWTKKTSVLEHCNRLKDLEYDAGGNLQTLNEKDTIKLSFNCCDNLVRATIINRPDKTDDRDYYVYDRNEMRTRKVTERVTSGDTQIEDKIYLGSFEIKRNWLKEDDGGKRIIKERQTLRVMNGDNCVAIFYHMNKDITHSKNENQHQDQCRYQLSDHLGSIGLEISEDAELISYEEYFPFGGTAIIAGKNESEVKLKEYRYSGKERDDNTGLYYYGRRYYASWLGRWINADPAGTVDGHNLFAFVGGNPIKFTDKDGLMMRSCYCAENSGVDRGEQLRLSVVWR
jgi:RHS repeat-associated protein